MSSTNDRPHTLRWTWFIRDTEVSVPKVRWLAYELAAGANELNEGSRGQAEFSRKIEVSKRTIRNYLEALGLVGLIEKEVAGGRKGKTEYPTNRYRLTFPSGPDEQQAKIGKATYVFDFSEARRVATSVATVGWQPVANEERQEERSTYVALPTGENGNQPASAPVVGASALDAFLRGARIIYPAAASCASRPADDSIFVGNGNGHGLDDWVGSLSWDEVREAHENQRISRATYDAECERRFGPITN